jgi:hypothetical protein
MPAALFVQSSHESPAAPHAAVEVPSAHVPPEQQLPLQRALALHVVAHVRVSGSHAVRAGQSAAVQQPH